MIKIYGEHSVDETILNPNGYVLDIGCYGFGFSKEIKNYVKNVICVDPNPQIKDIPDVIFENKAIVVSGGNKQIKYNIFNDKSGNSLLTSNHDWCIFEKSIYVDTITIDDIMTKYNISQFELIKIDIEGYEYELLNNIDWNISKQYSVEFHDFRGLNPYYPNDEEYYRLLLEKLSKYCSYINHKKTHHPGFPHGRGFNYWDSLFVLKNEYWKNENI